MATTDPDKKECRSRTFALDSGANIVVYWDRAEPDPVLITEFFDTDRSLTEMWVLRDLMTVAAVWAQSWIQKGFDADFEDVFVMNVGRDFEVIDG